MAFPAAIPLRVRTPALRRKTAAIPLSVIPIAFSRPMVEIFSKSRMSRPEITLKPATIVIRTSSTSTFRSRKENQLKMVG